MWKMCEDLSTLKCPASWDTCTKCHKTIVLPACAVRTKHTGKLFISIDVHFLMIITLEINAVTSNRPQAIIAEDRQSIDFKLDTTAQANIISNSTLLSFYTDTLGKSFDKLQDHPHPHTHTHLTK